MKSDRSASSVPIELSIAAGVALALSGQFPIAILAVVVWFILRRLKATAPSTVTLVTSLRLSTAILACVAVAANLAPPSVLIEVAATSVIALVLFFTGSPAWAYILILHSGFVAFIRILAFRGSDLTTVQQRNFVGSILLQLLIIWALVKFLRERTLTVVNLIPEGETNEIASAGTAGKANIE